MTDQEKPQEEPAVSVKVKFENSTRLYTYKCQTKLRPEVGKCVVPGFKGGLVEAEIVEVHGSVVPTDFEQKYLPWVGGLMSLVRAAYSTIDGGQQS